MIPVRWLQGLLYALLWATTSAVQAAPLKIMPLKIMVVLSKPDGAYADVAQALRTELTARGHGTLDVQIQALADVRNVDPYVQRPALIVTVGTEAARALAQLNPPAPILLTLLPHVTADEILRHGRSSKFLSFHDSAIYLDQPLDRQLELLRLALPRHKRVAALLGPATQTEAPALRAAARSQGLTLNIATLDERKELLHKLEDLLDDNDVLFSVPDPLVYSSETIHHILLTTYRHKVPVLGFSKAYADAGALLALYSTPEQIGRQVGQLLASLPTTGTVQLPAPSYPKYFLVSVNRRVAESLDLVIDDEATLRQRLEALPRH